MVATSEEVRGIKRSATSPVPGEPQKSAPKIAQRQPLPNKPQSPQEPTSSEATSASWHLDLESRSQASWAHKKPTPFQKPEQLTTFSYDDDRNLWHDDRSLRYFHIPPPGADLNRGFGSHVNKDETKNEHLDSLLYALMRLAEDTSRPEPDRPRQRTDIVTWRGQATKMCTALYEEQYPGFEMNAMLVNDTLYIEEHLTARSREDKNRRNTSNDSQDLMGRKLTYHGSSFESWCTSESSKPFDYQRDDPWGGDVNTNVQWCSIVKTKLGPHRLILGGEVDCIDDRGRMMELKMSLTLRNPRDVERFERKLLRFYMQSFLLGTERVLVGFRDKNRGKLETTHEFNTLEMPKAVRGKPHAWDQQACLNLASAALGFIKETIKAGEEERLSSISPADHGRSPSSIDGHSTVAAGPDISLTAIPAVYRISFASPYTSIGIARLSEAEVQTDIQGEEDKVARVGFLPLDYYRFALGTPRIYT